MNFNWKNYDSTRQMALATEHSLVTSLDSIASIRFRNLSGKVGGKENKWSIKIAIFSFKHFQLKPEDSRVCFWIGICFCDLIRLFWLWERRPIILIGNGYSLRKGRLLLWRWEHLVSGRSTNNKIRKLWRIKNFLGKIFTWSTTPKPVSRN